MTDGDIWQQLYEEKVLEAIVYIAIKNYEGVH